MTTNRDILIKFTLNELLLTPFTFFSTTTSTGFTATETRFFKMPDAFFDFFEFLRCSMLNSSFVEQCVTRDE